MKRNLIDYLNDIVEIVAIVGSQDLENIFN